MLRFAKIFSERLVLSNRLRVLSRQHNSFTKTKVDSSFVQEVRNIVGNENLSLSPSVLERHGRDEGYYPSSPPDVVAWPSNIQHVVDIIKLCYHSNVPIIPFGTGTGMEGGIGALRGGLCLALTKMNKIIEVNTDDFDCQVEAGVTWRDLNAYLHDTGLWFTVDPGASASLGGMASTCASGTNAVRYGTMKENVLNLEVVLSNGDIIHTNGELTRTRKSVAGYNLTNLFVGSEGTLGVITKVSLKLNPIPDIFLSVRCHFPTVKDATNTTIETLQSNVPVTKIELLDEFSMKATRKYRKSDLPENPTLFVEFNGNNQEVEYHCERFKEIAKENGCFDFNSTSVLEERNKLWKARHELLYALTNLKPNSTGISTDLCVPVSKLTEIIQKAQDMLREAQITGGILGHVGDGNFHAILLLPKDDESEIQRLKRFANKLGEYALSLGGTCTGEHGIGIGKKELLKKQFNAESLELMKRLKKVIDPKNLMNPGKVFDLS